MTMQDDRTDGVSRLSEMMRAAPEDEPRSVDPVTRRRRRRRRAIIAGVVVLVLASLLAGYVGWALNAPVGAAAASSQAPVVAAPEPVVFAQPTDGVFAVSATGAVDHLGPDGIQLAGGGDDPRPIASISKLITAMVVLDAHPLTSVDDPGPTITFDRDDHALYDKYYLLNATILSMPAGSSMSLRDAVETMLVASASNYAEAVADWAFGSQSAFVAATREWIAARGLTGTVLVEPTGIDPRNVSTPSDLMALARLAQADPVIAQITSMRSLDVPGLDRVRNTNSLLGSSGITGLKTGTLEGSGSNLLFTADLPVGDAGSLSVVGVVLGAFSRSTLDTEVEALLASIAAGFHRIPVAEKGQEVGTYTTAWGESARMVLGGGASVLTWSDTPIEATLETTTLTTGELSEEVGTVTYTAGVETATVPVVLESTIEPPSEWWRLTHPGDLGG